MKFLYPTPLFLNMEANNQYQHHIPNRYNWSSPYNQHSSKSVSYMSACYNPHYSH